MKLCIGALKPRLLLQGPSMFFCPYCNRAWERGGHKEGFVKVSATRHVVGCWELRLLAVGLYAGPWKNGKQYLYEDSDVPPRIKKGVKALARRRAREKARGS